MMSEDYHYTECGLTNVTISGIVFDVDEDGDVLVTIPEVNELHRLIATGIVQHRQGISPGELKFLRTEIGITQAELASLVHRDKQSVGRWERGEIEIDSAAETIIRKLAIEGLNLPVPLGIDELSRRSVPTAKTQAITIRKRQSGQQTYELIAA